MGRNKSSLDDCLVVPSVSALPPRCVHTNADVAGRDYATREIPFTPTWMLPAMLVLSPALLLILMPVTQGSRCRVRFGLSQSVRRKYWIRTALAGLAIPLGFVLPLPLLILADGSLIGMVAALMSFFVFFYGGFALMIYWASPLRIMRVRADKVWIRGCSPEFVASLGQQES